MKQKALATWLKIILVGIGICGLIVYFGVFPTCGEVLGYDYPEFSYRFWPWLIFLWVSGIPCYMALVLGWKIAGNIGRDQSFSNANAKYLKWIAWLAAGDGIYFFIGNIALLFANMSHPGVALFSILVLFVGVAVAVASAVLSYLVQKATALQEQSDYTI